MSKTDSLHSIDSESSPSKPQTKYRNFENIINSSGQSVVQYPFSGNLKQMEVMNNQTLFRKTTHKQSLYSTNPKPLIPKRPVTGSGARHYTISQFSDQKIEGMKIMDSSFGENFPFFSTTSNKDEKGYNTAFMQTETEESNRAKTPAIHKEESMGDDAFASPKGILKKPSTAQVGTRKRVHYNIKLKSKHNSSVLDLNSPSIKSLEESSYFNR